MHVIKIENMSLRTTPYLGTLVVARKMLGDFFGFSCSHKENHFTLSHIARYLVLYPHILRLREIFSK